MELLKIFGYISTLLIGGVLGLIGGKELIAVPVLAHLFFMGERVATAYSLFIVGDSPSRGYSRTIKGYVGRKTAIIWNSICN